MKMKRMLASMLAIAVILFSACGDDDDKATPDKEFSFAGEDAISLEDGNLYLVYEGNDGSGHMYRDYFITDGTYVEGSGWSLSDYTNATYVMAVQLGVPEDEEELEDAGYPMYSSFSNAPGTSNISWISLETSGDVYYEIPDDAMGEEEIEASGDFDDGDKMTIRFSGTLTNHTDAEVDEEGKIYFKGEVQDVRAPLTRTAARAARGGVK